MKELEVTKLVPIVINFLNDDKYRILAFQGGARSSKTYSICQVLATIIFNPQYKLVIDVARKTFPALRYSSMSDFYEILKTNDLYHLGKEVKTVSEYYTDYSQVRFFGALDSQNLRGRARDILYLNEANEFSPEDWKQFILRTRKKIIIDYNPSMTKHWIYDKVLNREDCLLIKSTFLDNPFLDSGIVQELKALEHTDPNSWKVYGLGERGASENSIFPKWELGDFPENPDENIYGLDFGYNAPSALTKTYVRDVENGLPHLHWKQQLYQSKLTNTQLIERLKDILEPNAIVYADNAEPQRIQEIALAGINIHPADKSVKDGILTVKRHKLIVDKSSADLQKEISSYQYKVTKEGHVLDEPVKFNDHLIDGGRYGTHTHYGLRLSNFYIV